MRELMVVVGLVMLIGCAAGPYPKPGTNRFNLLSPQKQELVLLAERLQKKFRGRPYSVVEGYLKSKDWKLKKVMDKLPLRVRIFKRGVPKAQCWYGWEKELEPDLRGRLYLEKGIHHYYWSEHYDVYYQWAQLAIGVSNGKVVAILPGMKEKYKGFYVPPRRKVPSIYYER